MRFKATRTLILALASTSSVSTACAVQAHEQRWTTTRVGDVEVLSSHDDETTHERIEDLLRFQSVVAGLSPLLAAAPEHATTVYLFSNSRANDPYKAHKLAGGFMLARPSANFVALDDSDPLAANRLLFHEYTHLLQIADRHQTYPRWYSEGFAEFMSTVEFARDEVRLGRIHPDRAVLLRHVDWLPFQQVVEWDGSVDTDERTVGLMYSQSWALVHYLEMGTLSGFDDRRDQTTAYLQAYAAGVIPSKAFVDSFGVKPNDLERDLIKHVSKAAAPYWARPESDFEIDLRHDDPVELNPSQVHTRLAELAVELPDQGQLVALALGEKAVQLDPQSARAHVVRGRSLMSRDGNDALAHFRRASELAPKDPIVALFHAQFLLEWMQYSGSRDYIANVQDLLAQAGEGRATASMSQGLRVQLANLVLNRAGAMLALERAWASNRADIDIGIRYAEEQIANKDPDEGCHTVRVLQNRPHLERRHELALNRLSRRCAKREKAGAKSTPKPKPLPPASNDPTVVVPVPVKKADPEAPEVQRPGAR